MWHVLGRGKMRIGFGRGNPKESDHLEDLGVNGRMILKTALKK
jgi:hypothetical protein